MARKKIASSVVSPDGERIPVRARRIRIDWIRIVAACTAVALLAVPLAWQLRPAILWYLRIAPQLREAGHGELLQQRSASSFGSASPDWPRLAVDNLSISAPIERDQRELCRTCSERCLLMIDGGTLAIFSESPDESYGEMLDLLAPDERDISVFRSTTENWRMIHALTRRVADRGSLQDTFRFVASGSRGVVSGVPRGDVTRLIVYAYTHGGDPTRIIGLTGSDIGTLHRILGSLKVEPFGTRGENRQSESDCS